MSKGIHERPGPRPASTRHPVDSVTPTNAVAKDYIVCCILKQHVETPERILCVDKGCIEAKLINTTSTTWNDLSTRTPQFRDDYQNGIVGIVMLTRHVDTTEHCTCYLSASQGCIDNA